MSEGLLTSLPWNERERIVVVEDASAKAERKARQVAIDQVEDVEQHVSWGSILSKVLLNAAEVIATYLLVCIAFSSLALIAIVIPPILVILLPLLLVVVLSLYFRRRELLARWLRWSIAPIVDLGQLRRAHQLRGQGVKVLTVSRSEAKSLAFPPGHPRRRIVYIGHPLRPSMYFPAAAFHRFLFQDKVLEAYRMLQYLGATQITVESLEGWGKEFVAQVGFPLGTTGVQVGAEGGSHTERSNQILWEATFDSTDRRPSLPKDLTWYQYEPTWQQIAEGRLAEFGLKDFSLRIAYEEDFGVNAGLKSKVSEVGLDMGGEFEDYQSTIWRIAGEFD